MSFSFTQTESQTFTLTHAKELASKVATDLKRIQRYYHFPSDSDINAYEAELVEYLRKGYLLNVTYGFQKNGNWIEPSLRYTASDFTGPLTANDDPGRIRPGLDISGASFKSYLMRNVAYLLLSPNESQSFLNTLPFQRGGAAEPGVNGYLSVDKTYSSGGKSLERTTVKSL